MHIRRLRLNNYLIGALDRAARLKLAARDIPTFDMDSGLTTSDYGWGTKSFRKLGLRKAALIIALLRAGADPVLTDADALVTRDPSPFIARLLPLEEPLVLVSSDNLHSTTHDAPRGKAPASALGMSDPRPHDDPLEMPEKAAYSGWNIGYMYISHKALGAMLHWQQMCIDHPTLWDQNLFKDILKIGGLSYERGKAGPTPPALASKRLFLGCGASHLAPSPARCAAAPAPRREPPPPRRAGRLSGPSCLCTT